MATDNAERQYLIAREMDLLLAQGKRTENHLFDLDYENDNDPEVLCTVSSHCATFSAPISWVASAGVTPSWMRTLKG